MRTVRILVVGAVASGVLAGCSSLHEPRRTPAIPSTTSRTSTTAPETPATPIETATPTSAGAAAGAPAVAAVYVVDSGFVVIATSPGPEGGVSGPRLYATNSSGSEFRNIGPRIPDSQEADSLFFLNREHGWLTTSDDAGGRETLYRTSDGGTTWQHSEIAGHDLAAGATSAVRFSSADDGWLSDIQPTGPGEVLYRTTDGGASWQKVAEAYAPAGSPSLPRLGIVVPGADGALWLAGPVYLSGTLDVSRDSGLTWHAAGIPVGRVVGVGLPSLVGSAVVDSVTGCDGSLRLFTGSDDGSSWTLASTANLPGRPSGCQYPSVALPSLDVGWAALTGTGNRVVIERSIDEGRDWRAVTVPDVRTTYEPVIAASDADHAWLLVPGQPNYQSWLYVTTDAGRTWRRVDQLITQ